MLQYVCVIIVNQLNNRPVNVTEIEKCNNVVFVVKNKLTSSNNEQTLVMRSIPDPKFSILNASNN